MKIPSSPYSNRAVLLDDAERERRHNALRRLMADNKADAILISDNANLFYLTGRVFDGYVYLPVEGDAIYFVRRPVKLTGDNVVEIHKPEQIAEHVRLKLGTVVGLELDVTPYNTIARLVRVFPLSEVGNASQLMRRARSIKTPEEIELIRLSGEKHIAVYREIPAFYSPGMSDIELQIEIERASRLKGCLGQFRISGQSMELYMGNLLVGENADFPSPYDFAMGGAGINPSLPVGADGTIIRSGNTVMVDMNGNFNGYMTDMTRTYAVGRIADEALRAHQVSIDIHRRVAAEALPGVKCSDLYHIGAEMAEQAGLSPYFMGHRQHAGFIGHGIGIEVNEAPVIAPRSRDVIEPGMVIALEPKFVIPGTGAVGIENTYVVSDSGLENLTPMEEDIIYLDN